MSEHHETQEVKEKQTVITHSTHESFLSKLWKPVVGVMVVGLLIAGAVWYQQSRSDRDEADISEIRNAFPPSTNPQVGGNSTSTDPFFGGAPTPPASTTTPVTNSPAPATPPVVYQPTLFSSTDLGFQVTVPAEWTFDQAQNSVSKALFFERSNGRLAGYAEVYSNTGGETLDSLEKIFRGSPDVSQLQRTTIAGTSALQYRDRLGGTTIATIRNNRIYYLHNLNSVISSLTFL